MTKASIEAQSISIWLFVWFRLDQFYRCLNLIGLHLYTANESPHPTPFCLFLSNLSLIEEGPIGQPK